MSKYTTQLRWIVEQLGNGMEVPEGQEYADIVYKYIGLDKYPIYNEDYRIKLNDKIIDHFYFREIGFETAAQFSWYMRRTMNEIMPKYNKLYESIETEMVHPLSDWYRHRNVDDDTVIATESSSHNTGASDSNSRNVYSDTPMSLLSNEGSPSVENLDYATNVTYDNAHTETEGDSSSESGSTTTGIELRMNMAEMHH